MLGGYDDWRTTDRESDEGDHGGGLVMLEEGTHRRLGYYEVSAVLAARTGQLAEAARLRGVAVDLDGAPERIRAGLEVERF